MKYSEQNGRKHFQNWLALNFLVNAVFITFFTKYVNFAHFEGICHLCIYFQCHLYVAKWVEAVCGPKGGY
jgi:hypothetical protein